MSCCPKHKSGACAPCSSYAESTEQAIASGRAMAQRKEPMTNQPYMPVKAKSAEWQTPRDQFDALDEEFGPFTLDAFASPGQYTAEKIIARGGMAFCPPHITAPTTSWREDGLIQRWSGRVWMNPPYDSKMLYQSCRQAVREIESGHAEIAVAFLPVKTEQPWWQEFVCNYAAYDQLGGHGRLELVRFLPRRQRYVGAGNAGATFPSCVVVWR